MPNTSLREAAPTASRRDATRTLSTSAQCPNSTNHPQKLATIEWCKRYI
ncbi:MAG: hypothetical protein ACYTXA_03505 [Nostoc sp.]